MALPDAIFRNAIDLNRYGNKVSTDVARRFVDICVRSVQELSVLDRKGLGDSYRAARLRSIVAQMEKSLGGWKKYANKHVIKELQGLAKVEAGFIEDQLQKVIPRGIRKNIQVNGVEISPKFAENIVSVDPTKIRSRAVGRQLAGFLGETSLSDAIGANMTLPNGNIVQDAFDKIADGSVQLFRNTVRDGLATGETTLQITRRLLGNSKENDTANILQMSQKGGLLTSPPINQVRTLVRTSINQVANSAALTVYQANSDITKKYRYTATLDSRTTTICGALDGRIFDYEQGPKPPQHFNCRSTVVPEIDYENLPFDPPPTARKRATADGPMTAETDYSKWLYMQPQKVKAQILGGRLNPDTKRYEGAFKYFDRLVSNTGDTRQALSKFVRADGGKVSLAQLQKRYGKPDAILARDSIGKKTIAPVKPRKTAKDSYKPTANPKTAITRGKDIVGGRLAPLDKLKQGYVKDIGRLDSLRLEHNDLIKEYNKAANNRKYDLLPDLNKREGILKASILKQRNKIQAIEVKGKDIMRDIREEAIKTTSISKIELRRKIREIKLVGKPSSHAKVRAELEEFGTMFNGAGITGGGKDKFGRAITGVPQQVNKIKIHGTQRAYNSPDRSFSELLVNDTGTDRFGGDYGKGTVFHEMGHSLEGMTEENLSMGVAFRNNRVKSMTPVSAKKLKGSITGGYDTREKVLADTFIHPYVGRPYRRTNSLTVNAPSTFGPKDVYDEATEVISMGAEHFIDEASMFRLYQADPDHFYMMMSLTRTAY